MDPAPAPRLRAVDAGLRAGPAIYGGDAERRADSRARAIVEWSCAARPTALRHDAAGAIAVRLRGVLEPGWPDEIPETLRPS